MPVAKTPLLTAVVACALMAALAANAQTAALTPEQTKMINGSRVEGARTWAAVCESCHGPPNPNTPARTVLLAMTADHIYETLTTGKMKMAGDTISDSEKRAVSMYLTGKPLNAPPSAATPAPEAPATPEQAAPPADPHAEHH